MSAGSVTPSSSSPSSSSPYVTGLTKEQLEKFDKDGYLVLEKFFTPDEADSLKSHVDSMLHEFDLSTHPRTIFRSSVNGTQTANTTGTGTTHQPSGAVEDRNKYFLDSADKVSFFFEEKAFDHEGKLTVPKEAAINKIGHALHVLDPAFHEFTYKAEVKSVAKSLGFKEPIVLQSMVICKQPRIGGVVTPHRDSTFLYTVPSTAHGLWFALEDCTQSNGCLSFVPGSHKDGANSRRFQRVDAASAPLRPSVNNPDWDPTGAATPSATVTDKVAAAAPNNDGVDLTFTGEDKKTCQESEFIPTPVKKGSCILIHGEVVHASTHNHSDKSRFIYTFHLIDKHQTTYPKENWLQSSKPFPVLE